MEDVSSQSKVKWCKLFPVIAASWLIGGALCMCFYGRLQIPLGGGGCRGRGGRQVRLRRREKVGFHASFHHADVKGHAVLSSSQRPVCSGPRKASV